MLGCQDCAKYLYAFLDHALGVKESLDVQEHLQACTRCADRAEAERTLRVFLRRHAGEWCVLPEPRKRQIIRHAMRSSPASGRWHRRAVAVHLRDVAIGMVAAAAVVFLVLRPVLQAGPANDLLQKLSREAAMTYSAYSGPGRYLPLEVARVEDTAVIEWVRNRMGSRLKVPWITDRGAQFVGGRFCRILDRKSAVLIYRHQGANVLLFTFKGDSLPPSRNNVVSVGGDAVYMRTVSGRPVAVWQHDGMTYSMVGNLKRDALLRLTTSIDYR